MSIRRAGVVLAVRLNSILPRAPPWMPFSASVALPPFAVAVAEKRTLPLPSQLSRSISPPFPPVFRNYKLYQTAGATVSRICQDSLRQHTRKAEWENIHWTGRTDNPLTCQGRMITSNVSHSVYPPCA